MSLLERVREFVDPVKERLTTATQSLWRNIRHTRMEHSRDDMQRLTFWRGVVAEFFGSLFLILIGCGASINIGNDEPASTVRIALAFGLGYAGIVHCVRDVSGGHVNPSITFAALVTRKISVARALLYFVAQILGAILGSCILLGVTASDYRGKLGCTVLGDKMSAEQGFGTEFFATFLFVFAWFAYFDPAKGKDGQTWAPFGIGLLLVAEEMFAVSMTNYAGLSLDIVTVTVCKQLVVCFHNWFYK